MVKNLPASAGDIRDTGSIPGLGRSPGGGHDNPLQHSCWRIPWTDGAWQATVHRIAKSQANQFYLIRLCNLSLFASLPGHLGASFLYTEIFKEMKYMDNSKVVSKIIFFFVVFFFNQTT